MTNKQTAEPLLIKAGDTRVLINGNPLLVDARIVAEEYYQRLLAASQQPPTPSEEWKEAVEYQAGVYINDGTSFTDGAEWAKKFLNK
jgi:hypothetical protein